MGTSVLVQEGRKGGRTNQLRDERRETGKARGRQREEGRGIEKEEAGWRKQEGRKRDERQGKERGRCGGREERSTKGGRMGKRGDDIVYQK